MNIRSVIIRMLGLFAVCLAAGAYLATLSLVILCILLLMAFLLGLLREVPPKYGMAVVSGLAFGAALASAMGWATPGLIG